MINDMYLNLVSDLYKSGAWDKATVIKKLTLYAKEKNDKDIIEWVNNFVNEIDPYYSFEHKKMFLSLIKLSSDDSELKYGSALDGMSEDIINEIYNFEESNLSREQVQELHGMVSDMEKAALAETKEDKHEAPKNWYKPLDWENDWYKPLAQYEPVEVVEEKVEEVPIIDDKSNNELDVDPYEFSFSDPVIPDVVIPDPIPIVVQEDVEPVTENVEPVIPVIEPVSASANDEIILDSDINMDDDSIVIGNIFGMPETEEEFQNIAENLNSPEIDSNVRVVEASPERINKLKMSKGKIKNFALKTALVVAALTITRLTVAVPLVFGYLAFSHQIQSGKFVPKNKFEKGVVATFEKLMYAGMSPSEIEEERGKSR